MTSVFITNVKTIKLMLSMIAIINAIVKVAKN